MFQDVLRSIKHFWLRRIYPSLASLIAAIGMVGLISCLSVLWLVAYLSDEILERENFAFNTAFLNWLHQFTNPTLDRLMLAITHLGSWPIVVPILLTVFLTLWLKRQRQEAQIFLIANIGAFILKNALKLFFKNPRPALWMRLITETSYSFPSGHALGSMVLYGMIAFLLARHFPKRAGWFYGIAAVLTGAIGFSRLYLGVHWVTDVVGGWGMGFLWLMICVVMLRLKQPLVV
ncbi:phosphatase PAP2 family protein [Leptolyngbya sp. FACHB-711]|uniref:phosphatase PAP2 family protein n=1 Tax=Leptolyngbya sp. FACHB-711 TaxID=2692813 RepID=UPI0016849E91|nr:phosphatase PAP2 family protein [Leptolyngbya sp. FACHB-711]MBD1853081.1 phosphatase PAP2 family protein [Cyanobacteria bacterium FACHB-502]MBD2023271.1 phosphatase PAP2 family protein [Leptolyngbya sp. FACHB-711]